MHVGRQASEADLVSLVKKKDTVAMRSLYEAHAQYLAAVCNRYLVDADEASDVLQDSFIKIFSSIGGFEWRGEGSLRAWMKRIVVNEALMRLRARARQGREFFSLDELPEDAPQTEEEPQIDGIPMEVLQKMIRSLPDGYRAVFNLYVLEQKSHKEIASILGISENTSYSQFSRAKSMLARRINEYRRDEYK